MTTLNKATELYKTIQNMQCDAKVAKGVIDVLQTSQRNLIKQLNESEANVAYYKHISKEVNGWRVIVGVAVFVITIMLLERLSLIKWFV